MNEKFKLQLTNKRIKILAQDILGQPSTIGQLWDTYKVTEAEILAPNFWDVALCPFQTFDTCEVRFHDAETDDIEGRAQVLMGYSKSFNDDSSVSQLLKLPYGSDYGTLTVKSLAELSAETEYALKVNGGGVMQAVWVFVDGKKTVGATVKVYNAAGTLAGTITIPNTATYGSSYSVTTNFGTDAGASYKVTVQSAGSETGVVGLRVVGLVSKN